MKAEIHPEYVETTITCSCGEVYHTRSTVPNLKIGICAAKVERHRTDANAFFASRVSVVEAR